MLIAESPGVSSLLLGILSPLNALFSIGQDLSRAIPISLGKPSLQEQSYYTRFGETLPSISTINGYAYNDYVVFLGF